ncbi:phage holin family protein [Aureibacter tunicatorum]|uniref:Membrane protein YqjE n=1 Tax=Aureibacter tunicatorum TaxID=866807 RepID=A0AAE3XIV6_9BACT|nr:phage holin family protein [Aureibacter tunicatorum]MDR6237230.1 putative membrane protein YqjE [Aureibacter tunicatorum]BDD06222.1 hypothetical protein AUTU_37050 [Aureibacter tunicatorum]
MISKDKNNSRFSLESLVANLTGYIDSRLKLLKIQAQEDIAKFISIAIIVGVQMIMLIWLVLFLSFALAFTVGQMLHHIGIGFFIITAFYFALFIIIFVKRNIIIRKIVNAFYNRMDDAEKMWTSQQQEISKENDNEQES